MSWQKVKLSEVLKQYRFEHLVQDDREYGQVTISKHSGVKFRGKKRGKDIGRKRQFIINLGEFPNTLLFVRQGVEDGAIGLAPKEVNGCIVTENMPMFSVENIQPKYLEFVIGSTQFKNELNKIQTTGSAQKSIHERQLLDLEIDLPNLETQNLIVEKFSSFHSKQNSITTELKHQLALVKELRQAYLREAMQGKLVRQDSTDEPAKILLEKIRAEKEKLAAEKHIKRDKPLQPINAEEIPFEIPSNWTWCRLGEICTKVTDGFHHTPRKIQDGKIYISATHIKDNGINWSDCSYIPEREHNELYKKAYPKKGEILITNRGAGCGTPALIDIEDEFSFQNAALIGFNQELINNKYIYSFILKSRTEVMVTFVNGGLQPMLSNVVLRTIPFPLPPLAEQERIVAKLEKLMKFCDELEANISHARANADQLLQTALKEALEPR